MVYADRLRIRVDGFDDHPLPENLDRSWVQDFTVGDDIDLSELTRDVDEILKFEDGEWQPHTLEMRYSLFSWGASGAAVEIVVGIASGAATLALDRLVTWAAGRFTRNRDRDEMDADDAVSIARSFVANARGVDEEAVEVDAVRRAVDGFEVEVSVKRRRFRVYVQMDGSVRLERL